MHNITWRDTLHQLTMLRPTAHSECVLSEAKTFSVSNPEYDTIADNVVCKLIDKNKSIFLGKESLNENQVHSVFGDLNTLRRCTPLPHSLRQ